jgi:hypothetical protein
VSECLSIEAGRTRSDCTTDASMHHEEISSDYHPSSRSSSLEMTLLEQCRE